MLKEIFLQVGIYFQEPNTIFARVNRPNALQEMARGVELIAGDTRQSYAESKCFSEFRNFLLA